MDWPPQTVRRLKLLAALRAIVKPEVLKGVLDSLRRGSAEDGAIYGRPDGRCIVRIGKAGDVLDSADTEVILLQPVDTNIRIGVVI